MIAVQIYSVRYCPYCAAARALLRRNGILFTDIDIAGNWENRDEMITRAGGQTTVPQIFINNVHIGDAADLIEFERTGKLESLLTAHRRAPGPE